MVRQGAWQTNWNVELKAGFEPSGSDIIGHVSYLLDLFKFQDEVNRPIATVVQLYLGDEMMYHMRRRKSEPTRLPTQGIFNCPHHIAMVWEELVFDDTVSYT